MAKSLYDILGVPADADAEQIRAAHDDLLARCPAGDATRRLALKEAIGTLGHPQRRAVYDASLRAASRHTVAVVADDATGGGPRWGLIALGGLLLLGLGAWFLRPGKPGAEPPKVVTTTRVVAPAQPVAATEQAAAPAPVAAAPAALAQPGAALSPEALFSQASASVVRINADAPGQAPSVGSGVVVGRETVVTNCHVTRGAARVKVRHGASTHDGSVVLADEAHDLCKLAVPGLAAPAVSLSDSSTLKVGQKVYAIGSPQGLDLTLSDGLVSALRQGPDGTFIQTTAPVSPGSSGGGLFADDGRLVGIITFQVRTGQNLNFALPAEWIDRMQSSVRASDMRPADLAPGVAAADPRSPLLGSWTCFGPLTGRGLTYLFEANGFVSGTSDGVAFRGRYALAGRSLTIQGSPSLAFVVEELTSDRLVLSAGQGRRLVCNR